MTSPSTADSSARELSFTSLNDDKPTTIILLHGGFACRLEFALVVPHLADFHILLPDLPLHSASRHIAPGTTGNAARHVAQLIESHAHGGRAHVVGVSMGGFVAQCLALDRPDLVLSLLVSGAAPATGARLFMARWTRLVYYTMKLMLCWLPRWVYRYQASSAGLKLSDELLDEVRANITWPLAQDMFPWILDFTLDHVRQLQVPTLHVGGAKGDDVPMLEKTADVLRSRRTDQGELRGDDGGSGAFVVREATHGWDLQFPNLFARGVSAWVNGEALPTEFERL